MSMQSALDGLSLHTVGSQSPTSSCLSASVISIAALLAWLGVQSQQKSKRFSSDAWMIELKQLMDKYFVNSSAV